VTGWLEVAIVAFGAQLAVLPGEKVQFIIAGLSTRYRPALVVAAAGSAFAGWTAVEILVGNALRGALPGLYLDLLTAGLFLLFGVMLYRSAPQSDGADGSPAETDGGVTGDLTERDIAVFGQQLPAPVATFVGIFSLMAVGEVGDKTQLITISLAIQYGATPAIWAGEMLAILPVSIANAVFFHRFAQGLDLRRAHYAAAAIFTFFALDTLLAVTTGFSVWEAAVSTIAETAMAVVPAGTSA
jgi:putative Ca2+/H+ antiporter (TMEM165/GDT1 family)